MFRHPENEYDWLSSDAAVDEVLLINEYTFTRPNMRFVSIKTPEQ